jgi:hypothetical protein
VSLRSKTMISGNEAVPGEQATPADQGFRPPQAILVNAPRILWNLLDIKHRRGSDNARRVVAARLREALNSANQLGA